MSIEMVKHESGSEYELSLWWKLNSGLAYSIVASYPGVWGEGQRKRTPGTHCLRTYSCTNVSQYVGVVER